MLFIINIVLHYFKIANFVTIFKDNTMKIKLFLCLLSLNILYEEDRE